MSTTKPAHSRRGSNLRPTDAEVSKLFDLQTHITETAEKTRLRNKLLVKLNNRGITQRALAEIISDASESAGGPAISEDGVQKAIRDYVTRYGTR